jgi:UDP-4-amino-4-deoxy-L-arabinose formyltransferase/UDP-glucuronic acid dehydrogenase (UDP-4-keto-hexauronic acid decarboxylating)
VVESVPAEQFYGQHYQDTQHRVPAIEQARIHLDWVPELTLQHSIETSLAYHLSPERRHLLPQV